MQHVVRTLQPMMRFDQQNVPIPGIPIGTRGQTTKDINSIDPKDVLLVVDGARLEHQESSFVGVDIRTIEREVLCWSNKYHVGFDVVKRTFFVAEVLSLKKDYGESVAIVILLDG